VLNSDIPILKTIDDKLSRGGFAEDLAKAIINRDTPDGFVIGMYGEWGSGKTSVVNMVVEQLELLKAEKCQNYVIMRFNPWLCADQKQLVSQFFKQLSATIKNNNLEHLESSRLENICGYMNDYAAFFELAGELPKVGALIKFIGKLRANKAKEKNNNVQAIKDEVVKNLRKCELRLIVTIDDIDRLSSEEIISVFQLVKSLADFPFTTYLLAFDREVVTGVLSEVHKGDGAKYLEKIVQVPFELPIADFDDIHNIFINKMTDILGDVPEVMWDKQYWSELFHYGLRHYLTTIRNAVRFTNTFSLKYAMVKDEVNPIDLVGLTCIQVFEPEVYSRLHFHKEMLCGSGFGYVGHDELSRKKREASWSSIISDIPECRHDRIKRILCGLFPSLRDILKSGFYSHTTWHEMRLTNSIAHTESFDRYFSLNLESDAIPTSHLEWLVSNASESEFIEAVRKLNFDMKSTKLLDYIHAAFASERTEPIDNKRTSIILASICTVWHELNDNEGSSFLSTSFELRFRRCVESLLNKLDDTGKYTSLINIFNDTGVALSTIAILLRKLEAEHNRFVNDGNGIDFQTLPLENVLELERVFMERVITEMHGGDLINNFGWGVSFLIENIDIARTKSAFEQMIVSDSGLINLINSAVSRGEMRGREVTSYYNVHRENISKYIDINIAYDRIKTFANTDAFIDLNLEAKKKIVAFVIHTEGGNEINFDFDDDDKNKIPTKDVDKKIEAIETALSQAVIGD